MHYFMTEIRWCNQKLHERGFKMGDVCKICETSLLECNADLVACVEMTLWLTLPNKGNKATVSSLTHVLHCFV